MNQRLQRILEGFARSLSISTDNLVVEPIMRGGNNQLFKITAEHTSYLLKLYFTHPQDPRNRLETEYSFLSHLQQCGVECVPLPLFHDAAESSAVYSFLEGTHCSFPTDAQVLQCARFFCDLNKPENRKSAGTIGPASEACFSLEDYFGSVSNRLSGLQKIHPTDAIDHDALEFVHERLEPCWREVRPQTRKRFTEGCLPAGIEEAEKRLSPSDFGFHNILIWPDGLSFIDFEYAGWDDPAKMVCDFFCHTGQEVPQRLWPDVLNIVFADQAAPETHIRRAEALYPLHQVKWVCLLLNEFLAVDGLRRMFAGNGDPRQKKRQQLARARALIGQIKLQQSECSPPARAG